MRTCGFVFMVCLFIPGFIQQIDGWVHRQNGLVHRQDGLVHRQERSVQKQDSLLDSVQIDGTDRLYSLIVDKESGRIYVGGRELLVHLNKQLEFKNSINITQIATKDNYFSNNSSSVTLLHIENARLLVCGTYQNGLCSWHNLRNISRYRQLNPIRSTNYLGSNGSVVIFPTKGKQCQTCLFVARPVERSEDYFISTRKLKKYNISIAYYRVIDGDQLYSGLKADINQTRNILLKPIYGFQYENFTYFVLQEKDLIANTTITKLGRICADDKIYYSYVEIKLLCSDKNKFYDETVTAHDSNGSLYLSANRITARQTIESAVCKYSVAELNDFYKKTNMRCFVSGVGKQPEWMTSTPAKCRYNYNVYHKVERDYQFCGTQTQHGLTGQAYLNKQASYITTTQITALVSLTQNSQPILILGTKTGAIKKVFVDERPDRKQEYASITVGSAGNPVQSPFTLISNKWVYFITGTQIYRLNTKSCSIHLSCNACLTNGDPNQCGWCGDRCSRRNECRDLEGHFSLNTCPPAIDSISPTNGSMTGGTLLTIKGDNFGSRDTHTIEPRVRIDGVDCRIIRWESKRLVCKTCAVRIERQGLVELKIVQTTKSPTLPYIMNGTTSSFQVYHYKEMMVTSNYPSYGPRYGGTQVTFYGKNLDIGGEKALLLHGVQCTITRISSNELVCTTSRADYTNTIDGEDDSKSLEILADGRSVYNNCWFEYRPNPVISDISPKITFNSGGAVLRVIGSNLDSVARPGIIVGDGKTGVVQTCEVQTDGNEMICTIPPNPQPSSSDVNLHFILDNKIGEIWNPSKTLTYYTDPVIYEFHELNQTRVLNIQSDMVLKIKGDNLSSTFSSKDVTVTIGDKKCPVTSLTLNELACTPHVVDDMNDTRMSVQVNVGNLEFLPGYVEYEILEEMSLLWCLFIPVPVLIIIIIIVLYIVKCQNRSTKYNKDFVSQKNIIYKIPDIVITTAPNSVRQSAYSLDDLGNKSLDRLTGSTLTLFEKDNLLIDRNHIEIGEEIGKGYFGCVYKGTYLNPESDAGTERIDIAIKTLIKKSPDESELNAFLEEALVMKDFSHENVLKLVGICLEDDSLPCVILPFMKNGNLLSYIRNANNTPTIKKLILLAIDVAKGMEYLTRLKFVHRDLATRNCLLDSNMQVKVADFGLTRDVYIQQYYSCKDGKARLPIKWMAIESIQTGTFTSMSDVWSYGVLLWELMTRGINPYPDVDVWDMQRYLKSGRRLLKPEYCPTELYKVMEKCWRLVPHSRPSFHDLVTEIPILLKDLEAMEESFKLVYVNLEGTAGYIDMTQNSNNSTIVN